MGYVSDTYNKRNTVYTFKCDNPVYKKLNELYTENGPDKVYTLRALYISDKSAHPHPVAALDSDTFADLPAHLMENVKNWRADTVLTDLINKGLVGITIYTYESENTKKYKKPCGYSIDLVDIEPETAGTSEPSEDDLPFPV